MRAVTERRELSSIAYGFTASKALFAALGIDLFTHLAAGPRTTAELSNDTGIPAHRLRTLLHALSTVGLIVAEGQSYTNAPACQLYLARGAPGEFGDYFRLQVAQQIYPALVHLDAGLAGTGAAFDTFADLLSRPDEARTFTAAQHAGPHAAARVLAERIPLGGARTMLDVGAAAGRSPSPCTRVTRASLRPSWTSRPWSTSPGPTAKRPVSPRASTCCQATPCTPRGRPARTSSCCRTCSARWVTPRSTSCSRTRKPVWHPVAC